MDLVIPFTWTQALSIIQRQGQPEAVIAGGALRDLDNLRPIKDIDVFVYGTRTDHLHGLRNKLMQLGVTCGEIDPSKCYPIGEVQKVVGFFDAEFEGLAHQVQVVMLDHPCGVQILDRIDYGICRIAWTGTELIAGPEYAEDKADKVFRMRMVRYGQELASSVHRYARLVTKFQGWTWMNFVDPAEALDLF